MPENISKEDRKKAEERIAGLVGNAAAITVATPLFWLDKIKKLSKRLIPFGGSGSMFPSPFAQFSVQGGAMNTAAPAASGPDMRTDELAEQRRNEILRETIKLNEKLQDIGLKSMTNKEKEAEIQKTINGYLDAAWSLYQEGFGGEAMVQLQKAADSTGDLQSLEPSSTYKSSLNQLQQIGGFSGWNPAEGMSEVKRIRSEVGVLTQEIQKLRETINNKMTW